MLESKTIDMTDDKPVRLMVRFALPLLFVNVLSMLFTVIDSAVLGRILGVNAFAAVGATASPHWLIFSFMLGIMQGFGVLFAQRFGSKDHTGLRRAVRTSVVLTAAISTLVAVGYPLLCRPLLELLRTPAELMDDAALYLNVFFAGAPITFAYNLAGTLLRSLGDSKTPLRAAVLATLLNIALDFALVLPFGVAGVSAATLISQLVACVYCFPTLRRTGYLGGDGWHWDTPTARELLRLSIPLGLRNVIIETGGLIVQWYTNDFGTVFVAGTAAARRMYTLLLVAGGAVEAAVSTFVAQNAGARKWARVKRGVNYGLLMMLAAGAFAMAITLPFGRQILGLFIEGDAPEVVTAVLDIGVRQLTLFSLGLPILSLLFIYRSSLQGVGNSLIPMLSGFVELVTRMATVILLTPSFGQWGVLLSSPTAWVTATVLLLVSYYVVASGFEKRKVV
uniref:Multi antimicrobial extrusion protein n=1 Tax=uncultured bacterium contig00040 TaxID=1181528 RepID=A0A806KEP3_9BACT|nr:multi antimicrobial extrusion protein [uncultured bacterium contig00040]